MKIQINKVEIEYTRPKLKTWLMLQDQQEFVREAVEKRNDVAKHIVSFISTALCIPEEELSNLEWDEVASAYVTILSLNVIKIKFPFLNSKTKNKQEIWDYKERTWYIWAHLFAKEYGYSLEYIADLEIEDAVGLAQEIAVEDQLSREWEWMTSEIAYQAKDGFKELPRPSWMLYNGKEKIIPKLKIRKDLMPVGIAYHWDQETKH